MARDKYDPADDHEPMFEVTPVMRGYSEPRRTTYVRAVDHAFCPECRSDRRIGLLLQGQHLVWRVHEKVTMSGARMQCGASGAPVCTTRPRPDGDGENVNCKHARASVAT